MCFLIIISLNINIHGIKEEEEKDEEKDEEKRDEEDEEGEDEEKVKEKEEKNEKKRGRKRLTEARDPKLSRMSCAMHSAS